MKEAQPKFVGFSGNLMVFSDSPLLTGGTVKEAQPTRTERLEKLAKWQGPVYQEEAYNMAEEILRLRAELEQVRRDNQWLRSNFCERHQGLCTMSSGPCGLCKWEASESREKRLKEALLESDSMLSLLRHRAGIKWGGMPHFPLPTESEVDEVIGKSRRALEGE